MDDRASALIDAVRDGVQRAYGDAVGRGIEEIVTPALILDLPSALRNIALMAERMSHLASDLRPHVKVHKSPELAQRQVDSGAVGVCVATVWEAMTMAAAGLDDIFVVNTVVGAAQIEVLVGLARTRRVLVAVDNVDNVSALSAAARRAGSTLGVLVEVDTGMDRAGVDDAETALTLARHLLDLPGLKFEGLTGYEGHCSLITDAHVRATEHRIAMESFADVASRLIEAGIPVDIRSAGGTATWEWTAAYPGVTEIQAGSYVVMDNFHRRMVADFENALSVLCTVVSRPPDRVVVDAGSKAVADPELATIKHAGLANVRFDEEHGIFAAGDGAPPLGAVVEVIPGYAPSTVNMFDAYHVVRDGVVVDIWPIVPRGSGHLGLASRRAPG